MEMENVRNVKLHVDEIAVLLEEKHYSALKLLLSRAQPADIAELLEQIEPVYLLRTFRLLTKQFAAEVFVELSSERQELIISSYTDTQLSEMLAQLYIDDTVDLIEEMPANIVKRILRSSSGEDREIINRLLKYPKDSAGSMMTTEYVRLRADMTVEDAILHLRRVAIDKETIYTCYVTDAGRHLIGIVTAKTLLISDGETPLSEIMTTTGVVSVSTETDREMVAHFFEKYGFLALPVVDRENRLVGIITVDDAMVVIQEEVEEDFAKMAAITPSEEPYLRSSVLSIFRSRIPWLLLLMISATFSSMILGYLNANGVSTHFVEQIDQTGQLCRVVEHMPLEVIVRNVIAGSMAKRLGIEEGIVPENTIFDLCLRDDKLGDPLVNDHHVVALGIATYEEIAMIYDISARVNNLLVELFDKAGITLVDFKIEFGRAADGTLILADELTPDTCRLWDKSTGERMDKDRFRRDLGRVRETYQEVATRLSNVLK